MKQKMLYPDFYPDGIPHALYLEDWRKLGINQPMLDKFYETLMLHIAYVQEAGDLLGVPAERLRRHDMSKFSIKEFAAYAKHFHGGGSPDEFAHAWLHHIHHNDHHWQHWMFADGYTPRDSAVQAGILPMPEDAALEMLADWIGAGKAYTGEADMTDWLKANLPRISVHSDTSVFLRRKLIELGYSAVAQHYAFRSEVLFASNNV